MNLADPQLGAIALARGWVTKEQLAECLGLKRQRSADGQPPFIGSILVEKGFLSPERLQWLVLHQERYRIECPHCHAKLLAPELPPGRRISCPKCAAPIVLAGPGKPVAKSEPDPEVQPEDPLVGRTLQGYRIEARLAAGGMGVVYRATQLALNRTVAVKVMANRAGAGPDFAERFKREAMAAARLNHPNIVQVYDAGHEGDILFFSMEYLEGQTLSDLLHEKGKLPCAKALQIMREVVKGLAYAHGHGVIHRDIKPDNILITQEGRVKLADLGLAKMRTTDMERSLTMTGAVIGTAYYMSPEQARDTRHVDARTDLYSLGATFFHAVTGTFPFDGDSPVEVLLKIQKGPVPAAHEADPEVPWIYGQVITRMMAHDPNERFQSAQELLKSFDALARTTTLHGAGAPAPGVLPAAPAKPRALSTGFVAALGLGALATLAAGFLAGRATAPGLSFPQKRGPGAMSDQARPAPESRKNSTGPPVPAIRPDRPRDPLEAFLRDLPEDPQRRRVILEWLATQTPVENPLRDEIADRLSALGPLPGLAGPDDGPAREGTGEEATARWRESVLALAHAGRYAEALQEERRASQSSDLPPAQIQVLGRLPTEIQRIAGTDFERVQRELLRMEIQEEDPKQQEEFLAAAALRYAPFEALARQARQLQQDLQAFHVRRTPLPPDSGRAPPPTEKPPPREEGRTPKKPKAKVLEYFRSEQDLEDWRIDYFRNPEMRDVPKPVQFRGGGFIGLHPQIVQAAQPKEPDGGRKRDSPPLFVLLCMTGLKNPQEIQFLWKPGKSRTRGGCRMFLEKTPPKIPERDRPGTPPAMEFLQDPDDARQMRIRFPLFEDREEPGSVGADPAGFLVTMRFLREESGDRIDLALQGGRTPKGKPLAAKSFSLTIPESLWFWICLDSAADEIGQVRLAAEDFDRK